MSDPPNGGAGENPGSDSGPRSLRELGWPTWAGLTVAVGLCVLALVLIVFKPPSAGPGWLG